MIEDLIKQYPEHMYVVPLHSTINYENMYVISNRIEEFFLNTLNYTQKGSVFTYVKAGLSIGYYSGFYENEIAFAFIYCRHQWYQPLDEEMYKGALKAVLRNTHLDLISFSPILFPNNRIIYVRPEMYL